MGSSGRRSLPYSAVTYVYAACDRRLSLSLSLYLSLSFSLAKLSNERYTCSDVCAIKYIWARAYIRVHHYRARHASERARMQSRPARALEALEPVFNERACRKKREKRRNTERKRTRKGQGERGRAREDARAGGRERQRRSEREKGRGGEHKPLSKS